MKLRSLAPLLFLFALGLAFESFAMEAEVSVSLVKLEDQDIIKQIKQANIIANLNLPNKTNILPDTLSGLIKYTEKLWDERILAIKKQESYLFYAHQNNQPLCAMFIYPAELKFHAPSYQTKKVIINAGLIMMSNDIKLQKLGVQSLAKHIEPQWPGYFFLAYQPKDFTVYGEFLNQLGFKAIDLSSAKLEPNNLLEKFSPDKFIWYIK